jgi:NAD(P)-dependent dehydrogenase (short-subunit alcohol dehydrogenase family)
VPVEDYDRICHINARGTFICMQAELSAMMKQQPRSNHQYPTTCPRERGTIVNVASLAGIAGVVGMAPYVASKHAVVGLTRCAALEYARESIRVNAVCPSQTDTPMIAETLRLAEIQDEDAAATAYHKRVTATNPSGRMAHAEEVANACLFLTSGDSTFINGATLNVDGGVMSSTTFYKPL